MNSWSAIKIKFSLLTALALIWIYPLLRWISTLRGAMQADREEQSLNSHADVVLNWQVGGGYLLCWVAAIIAIWRFKPTKIPSWFSVTISIVAGCYFCIIPYDGLVILVPDHNPIVPTLAGLFCLFGAVLSWELGNRIHGKLTTR